ncbi:Ig-like domain-containing protein [Ruania suaedae]|uniref:Ig-like domain-containing protein n=1 Tax=Ruania suaedae TaxID=2897774 RepID=UPI001E2A9D40|nr:Ig-like domain-containing protein [Ruania suaedae]UFU01841.1 Ig-like domain-containing protein [Ruania suaedae]
MKRARKPALVALGALVVTAALGPVSATAAPPEECGEAPTCTELLNVTGEPVLWTVPDGVEELSLTVAAGAGGNYFSDGGAGGRIETVLSVEPGDELAFVVGDRGHNSSDGGAGGYGGGASSFGNGYGAGGGGGSFVFAEDAGSWEPLLIAGGGGGGSRDQDADFEFGGDGYGGDGGFTGSGPDAAPADPDHHAAGATVSAAGYRGGPQASFDGATFTPGSGQTAANYGGTGAGGGGGGYYGGAAAGSGYRGGGGGSGFAAADVAVTESANEQAAGFIEVSYVNLHTAATVSASTEAPLAGDSVTLTGQIGQFDAAGGSGTLAFLVTSGGEQTTIETVDVTTEGSGPFTASAEVEFVPPQTGEYVVDLVYTDDGGHYDTTAEALTLVAGPRASATTLTTDPESPVEGEEVVLTATVNDAETTAGEGIGPVSGTVTFVEGETTIGSAEIVDGVATLTWEPAAGDYDLSASYAGDATYSASEAQAVVTVDVAPTPTPTPTETDSPTETPEPSETPAETPAETPSEIPAQDELPETGGEPMIPALLTLGLLAAGAVLLLVRRARVS